MTTTPDVPPLNKQVVHVKGKHYDAVSGKAFDVDELDATLALLGIELVVDKEVAPWVQCTDETPCSDHRRSDAGRTEPEWLTKLRAEMLTEVASMWEQDQLSAAMVADRTTGLAASYLHSLYRVIADLETDVEEAGRGIEALKAQVARRDSTIRAYDADLAEKDAEVLGLTATRNSQSKRLRETMDANTQLNQHVTALFGQVASLESKMAERDERIEGLAFDLRKQEDVVQELRGERLDATEDLETKLGAMRADMRSAGAGVGIVTPLKAAQIAERHMLGMVSSDVGHKEGRWAAGYRAAANESLANACKTLAGEPQRWHVGCGCGGHGDHLACTEMCVGCVHPIGVEASATTEARADALHGIALTPTLCGARNPDYPNEPGCTFPAGHGPLAGDTEMQEMSPGVLHDHGRPEGGAWWSIVSTPAPPSPEMREVPDRKFVAGDTITITALAGPQTAWSRGPSNGVSWDEIDLLKEIRLYNLAEAAVVTVTRPVSPLPTPGQVAYEAARTERLTRRPSDEVIGWDELNEGTRSMWEAAASAVLDNGRSAD